MKWLMEPLLNGDEAERSENETVILDLALNVIRNLLHVEAPMNANGERYQVPASIKARLQTAQDALLKKFAEENVLEMLVLLAQSVDEVWCDALSLSLRNRILILTREIAGGEPNLEPLVA